MSEWYLRGECRVLHTLFSAVEEECQAASLISASRPRKLAGLERINHELYEAASTIFNLGDITVS